MGGRRALSGSCVGQDGWVDEERGREGIVAMIKGGGWVYFYAGGEVMRRT